VTYPLFTGCPYFAGVLSTGLTVQALISQVKSNQVKLAIFHSMIWKWNTDIHFVTGERKKEENTYMLK
jgi:hypothetical protein